MSFQPRDKTLILPKRGAFPLGRHPANQEGSSGEALPPASPRLCSGWISLPQPAARLVSCAPVSRYVRRRQWPLSADNGQREAWRGGQGLRRDNRLSESSGRVGAAGRVLPGSLLKGTIYRPRSLWKMDALRWDPGALAGLAALPTCFIGLQGLQQPQPLPADFV